MTRCPHPYCGQPVCEDRDFYIASYFQHAERHRYVCLNGHSTYDPPPETPVNHEGPKICGAHRLTPLPCESCARAAKKRLEGLKKVRPVVRLKKRTGKGKGIEYSWSKENARKYQWVHGGGS